MFVLITYDINTETAEGRKRLRYIAKICQNHGQRVQNSVFECIVDPVQFLGLKNQVNEIINKKTDSVRYYKLGSTWSHKVEHIGAKQSYDPAGFLII